MGATRVVGRGPDGFSRTLQVDRGTADGVQPGMIVVTSAGLVGRVREAGPHGAIVQTLADPQSRVNVFLSKSALQGTITGGPTALQLQVEHSLGIAASSGEWALTSGGGGGYPRGLVVGELASVTPRDSSTRDQARAPGAARACAACGRIPPRLLVEKSRARQCFAPSARSRSQHRSL